MFTSGWGWFALLAASAALGVVVGWVVGGARARLQAQAEGEARFRDLETGLRGQLREAEGQARAAGATVDELRRQVEDERTAVDDLESEVRGTHAERAALVARLEESERNLKAQRELLEQAEKRLSNAFSTVAADALRLNNESFLTLAAEKLSAAQQASAQDMGQRQQAIESLVKPVQESLSKVDAKIAQLEQARGEAYGRLTAQVAMLADSQTQLRNETTNLVRALRAPAVRGRWGEVQLKRVVEMAGMLEHCDFGQQVTLGGSDGKLRPDLLVRLPGQRHVVVDAKVPLEAYLDAVAATDDDERARRLRDHAQQVRAHLQKLGAKNYWEQLAGSPEFVVLFLPGEAFFSAALEAAPSLLEEGVGHRVLIATPTTLIALLQTVQVAWREERIAENAQKISEQGRVLHKAATTLFEHWAKLGRAIDSVNGHFNAAVGSLDKRVIPAARKLEELGAGSSKDVPELLRVDVRPRLVAVEESAPLPLEANTESVESLRLTSLGPR